MTKLLMTVFFLINLLFLKCQNQNTDKNINEDIAFISLQSHYNKTDKFSYQLINNTSNNYQYYVGLEANFKNTWNEVLIDIDPSAPDKSAIIKSLLPNQNKTEAFLLLKFFPAQTDTTAKENNTLEITGYRFVLNYSLKNKNEFKQKYSKSFLVD